MRAIALATFALIAGCTACGERAGLGPPSQPTGRAPSQGARPDPPPAQVAAASPATSAKMSAEPPATPRDLVAEATLALPIPARSQAPESPSAGWCGETAIQEGLLHLGVWSPQRLINSAGRPVHPDLYSPDIPVALTELGVRHSFYAGPRGFEPFAKWARAALAEGVPVLAGVKILPTAHPEWGLDHFVLVVGHGPKGLLVNTTWGTRQWVSDTTTSGLSLRNAFYGIRLGGLALPAGATPARLTLLDESPELVKLRVSCTPARAGARYRVERRSIRGNADPTWSEEVTADGGRIERELTVAAVEPARFDCMPVD